LVNLLSNDVEKFDRALLYLPWLVIGPVQLGIVVCLTWQQMGPATLAGMVVLLFGVPLQGNREQAQLE
jgi:ATP-binding cassette subfamily C (CFTR/MRP) protein 4